MSENETRRIVSVPYSSSFVSDMMREGWTMPNVQYTRITCIKGIPADAIFVRASYDPVSDCIWMFFEHPSFEPVELGSIPPRFYVTFEMER